MVTDNKIIFIAEAGVNHNGDIDNAFQLIDVAANAGADIIKFQYYKTEKLLKKDTPKAEYQKRNTSISETQFEMLKKFELANSDIKKLIERCDDKGIEFLATPFDEESLNELISYGIKRIKIPSGEITNGPLLLKSARSNLPLILSTGMSNIKEIEDALGLIVFGYLEKNKEIDSHSEIKKHLYTENFYSTLNNFVTVLHCTSQYPAPLNSINLNTMREISKKFNVPIGYSDHSEGSVVAIASAALGAKVIEKHFTLNKNLPGPDHKASIEPKELSCLIKSIRDVELVMGSYKKKALEIEVGNRSIARKSLTARKEIKKGTEFSRDNLIALRPGNGVSPMKIWDFIGKKSNKSYKIGELIENIW
ncbi:MAG: N,N'-diacetyllegionaminic acid synthase [Alphaproteobacteria bacterium MarineAlpha2_Bin1]|nr:MAG: N,N'-diacetyllegionaminic acid synthase [Alphaproteobacteria bacterium MarineAlpha2_Bin1]